MLYGRSEALGGKSRDAHRMKALDSGSSGELQTDGGIFADLGDCSPKSKQLRGGDKDAAVREEIICRQQSPYATA